MRLSIVLRDLLYVTSITHVEELPVFDSYFSHSILMQESIVFVYAFCLFCIALQRISFPAFENRLEETKTRQAYSSSRGDSHILIVFVYAFCLFCIALQRISFPAFENRLEEKKTRQAYSSTRGESHMLPIFCFTISYSVRLVASL